MAKKLYYDNGYYEGGVDDSGKRSGYGTYYWKNNEKFEGFWSNDKAISGKYYFKNQDIYDGPIKYVNNKFNITGYGTLYFTDKSKYVGDVVNGHRHGLGKITYRDGVVINGHWKDDVLNGECKLTTPSGGYIKGIFLDDGKNINVKGKLVKVDGKYYEGEFIGARLNGKGSHHKSDGTIIYVGEFIDNIYNGKGKFYYTKDFYYEGDFVDGKFHGQGILHYGANYLQCKFVDGVANGKGFYVDYYENKITEGVWKNGTLEKETNVKKLDSKRVTYKQTYKNGDYYIGELYDNVPHGFGVYHKKTNIGDVVYRCKFVYGKCNGFGTYTSGNYTYTGEIKNFYRHGYGVQHYPDGAHVIGKFVKDEIHGLASFENYTAKVDSAEGKYKYGRFIGKVFLEFINGQIYVGKVKNWTPHGKGVLYYENNHYLIGKFKNGQPNGVLQEFIDGDYYISVYRNGQLISKELIKKKDRK